LSDLKKDYNLLKYKLGRIPMMMDFIEYGSRDPYLYVDYINSFYNFVVKVEKEYNSDLSLKQIKLLELFSKEINNSKRVEESLILKLLIDYGKLSLKELKENVFKKYHYTITDETINSCVSNLNFEFIRAKKNGKLISVKEIYNLDIIKLENGSFVFSNIFLSYLNQETFKTFLTDSTSYSIYEFDKLFKPENWQKGFVLYRKYSRKDVFRILNVAENPVAQNVGGYLVSPDNTHCPIFVNYHKEDDISESTKYEDKFVNAKEFDWMSKSNRKINSNDVKSILGKNGTIRLPLFIKKNNDEGMDFYYMGEINPLMNKIKETTMKNDSGQNVSVVKIRFNLINPVSTSMYNYLEVKGTFIDKKLKKNIVVDQVKNTKNFESTIRNPIPLYDFYAAAGTFSEKKYEKDFTLIEGPENSTHGDYFACKIVGESMNRAIPNGSICLFKTYTGGSRNGKIVLVENTDIQDQDFNSAFTIKTYSSEKIVTDEGWEHTSIILRPNSFDTSYKNIIINEDNSKEMRVVGEFISIINQNFE